MIPIPAGFTEHGLEEDALPSRQFGWRDACSSRVVWLPPFLIDRYPVTNAEYDRIVEGIEALDHR